MIDNYQRIQSIIIFEISNTAFCANLDDVYIIKKVIVPNQEEMINRFEKGYTRSNNDDIVLIDMAKYFDLPATRAKPSSRIIIINHFIVEGQMTLRYGFMVDKVNEIVALSYNNNYQLLNFTKSGNDDFLEAKLLFENRELLLPDFSKIGALLLENKAKCSN